MKKFLLFILCGAFLATSLIGCNMFRGAGKDVSNAGHDMQNAGK